MFSRREVAPPDVELQADVGGVSDVRPADDPAYDELWASVAFTFVNRSRRAVSDCTGGVRIAGPGASLDSPVLADIPRLDAGRGWGVGPTTLRLGCDEAARLGVDDASLAAASSLWVRFRDGRRRWECVYDCGTGAIHVRGLPREGAAPAQRYDAGAARE